MELYKANLLDGIVATKITKKKIHAFRAISGRSSSEFVGTVAPVL